MNFVFSKPRILFWYLRSFLAKKARFIFLGLFIGIFLSTYWFSGLLIPFREIFSQENSIGLVGKYSFTSLPADIQNKISFGLTKIENGQATPSAAISWRIENNGKQYIFTLNDKLKWQDGQKFTSYDVNYRLKDVEIQAYDSRTIVLKLKEPFASLPTVVSQPLFKKELIGLGDYKVNKIEWKDGFISYLHLISLTNSDDQIIYKFYFNEEEAYTALRLKKITRLENIQNINLFSPSSDFIIKTNTNYQKTVTLFYNVNKEPFTDKFIRNGLSYAVPDTLQEGFTKAVGPFSPKSWYFNNNLKEYSENRDLAQKYLKDVITKESTSSAAFTIKIDTLPGYKDIAVKIAESWSKIGIKSSVSVVKEKPTDFMVFLAAIETTQDPDQYFLWHSTQTSNITGLKSPRIDKILEDGRKMYDETERKKKYQDFQKYLVEENPALFLYYTKTYTVSRL